MSMVSEQVKYLRNFDCFGTVKQAMNEAADTIEALSAKLVAANMSHTQDKDMTLDEAIEHLNDILKDDRKWDCEKCKNEHVQLREWLLELKKYRHQLKENMERSERYYNGGWILCSERLPENIEDDSPQYLITVKVGENEYEIDFGWWSKMSRYDTNQKKWIDYFGWTVGNDWDEGQGMEVIAWCELPKPYKPDKE